MTRTTMLLAAAALSAVATAAETTGDGWRRLGQGPRLVELAELETREFPADALARLESWSGQRLTPRDIDGRVVVLLAWDASEARSVRLLPTLARLERTRGDDAVFLAVHGPDHWADAKAMISDGRVQVPTVLDPDGRLLEALGVDEHPNLYLIDRAGRVRTADLDPRDLSKALAALRRESREQAEADLSRRVERFGAMPRPEARPEQPATPADPASGPLAGPGTTPGTSAQAERIEVPASAYARAAWPEHNAGPVNARNLQGQRLDAPAGTETWLTDTPPRPVDQHVIVLDFWATWCGPCIAASPKFDAIQKQYPGEVLVLAMSGQAAGRDWPEDEPAIRRFIERHPVSYSHLHDPSQTVFKAVKPTGIPHVVVMSTDGVVRWQGNPHDGRFVRAVAQVVREDPLLKARREAGASQDDRRRGARD